MGWELEWGMACDRGVTRRENQDAMLLWLPDDTHRFPQKEGEPIGGGRLILPNGASSPAASTAQPRVLALVADGMGGMPGGAQASQLIVATVADAVGGAPQDTPPAFLRGLMDQCQDAILETAHRDNLPGMGSTCTMLLLQGSQLYLAHVGDSRCYHLNPSGGEIVQWSRDQNVATELIEQGLLTPQEARTHHSSHTLTQAVGLGKPLRPQMEEAPLPTEGTILLLCSDGLLRVVEDHEILQCVDARRAAAPDTSSGRQPMQEAADQLVDLANRRGSPDNVSVGLLKLLPATD